MPLRLRTGVGFAILFTVAMGLHFVLTDRGLEPASVVAKAWDQIDRISRRACTRMERALVTGAGPIGLLAALLARQRGLEVHVVDVVTDGPKPELVRSVVFGAVNANRRHYELAATALEQADRAWLERLVTRWAPIDDWQSALERRPDDVKVAIDFGSG